MAAVKDAGRVSAKWARVTPERARDYSEGIQQPRAPWAASATAAQPRYVSAVQEAAARGAYAKGITKAGDQRWQQKSLSKGPSRFAAGVAESGPDYQAAMAPVLAAIGAVQLPPRAPTGSPANIQRVAVIAAALRKLKTG
jgi:hypothetical protein